MLDRSENRWLYRDVTRQTKNCSVWSAFKLILHLWWWFTHLSRDNLGGTATSYPNISIIILDMLSHDLISYTIDFTMVGPSGIVYHKSILVKMFTYKLLCLSTPVCTTAARTPSGIRSSGLCKCSIQESIGLLNPFIALVTPTGPAYVHPLTVIHPLTYQQLI